jgi:hypothetical protein
MAVTYVWPAGLPQFVAKNFSGDSGANILRTPMDAGPAKERRRSGRASPLQVQFFMTSAQIDTLETFVNTTLRGTARFGFNHPRKQTQVEVRIIPQQDGALYKYSFMGGQMYSVTMSLEVLP